MFILIVLEILLKRGFGIKEAWRVKKIPFNVKSGIYLNFSA
jgi:hypothetical protein